MPEVDYSRFSPFSEREGQWLASMSSPNSLVPGQDTMSRFDIAIASASVSSQSIRFTFFTATRDETVTRVEMFSGTTAAAATPTLIRMGLYTVADNGDLTLVASTPNDTTLFAATTTLYNKALSAPYAMVKGQRYAFGILVVTAVATPTFYGHSSIPVAVALYPPRLAAAFSGQADLPASIASASLIATNQAFYAAFLP